MTAARTGQFKVMEQLIAHGADVNAHEDKFHQTALMWSAGHPEQVKLLIEHGAQVRARTRIWQVTNTIYRDPAAGFAWESVGEYVSQKGGQNALFFAVRKDDIESAKALLAAGVDVNDRAADGSTALLTALYKWQAETWRGLDTLRPQFRPNLHTANLLLDHGAMVNVADATGVTPLHGAVLSLLPQTPTDMRLATSDEPPAQAKLVVDPEEALKLIRRLLDLKANPHAVTRYAAEEPSDGILLDHTPPGSSPLHIGALTGNVELVKLLLARDSDPTLTNQNGHDPLSIAVKANDLPLVTLLASDRADLKRVYQPVDTFREPPADTGADISGAPGGARGNQTILHIAAGAGSDKVIAFLVERGAPLNARNDRGETPLDLADAQERVRFAAAKSSQERKKLETGVDSPAPIRQTNTSEAIKSLMRAKTAMVRAPR